jgi:hypothetical protein
MAAVATLAATAAAAPAQSPARFRTVESDRLVVQSVRGTLGVTIESEGEFTMRQVRPDSVVLTYTSLSVEQYCACGRLSIDTKPIVGTPIAIRLDASGRARVLSNVPGDDAGGRASDPVTQFGGMIFRVDPSHLVPGAEWTDSTTESRTRTAMDSTAATTRITRKGAYRVLGDTSVAGHPGWIVSVREQIRISDRLKTPEKGIGGNASLEGTDEGIVVVARDGSGFLLRSERASLQGWLDIPVDAIRSPVRVPVRTYFDATLTRLP